MSLRIGEVEVEDTFAEAFPCWVARILITAESEKWLYAAAYSATGFATSLIMSPAEAGIERYVPPSETPDGRPGIIIQITHPKKEKLEEQLLRRIGQCVMTCPTTAVFNALESEETVDVGDKLRFFGDGFQEEGEVGDRFVWRIPVMEGEFLTEDVFGVVEGVAGGNFIIMGKTMSEALKAAEVAVEAMRAAAKVVPIFPGGVCRSGSKVGSLKYEFLHASTNHLYCPTLRDKVPDSKVPPEVNAIYEVVFNGISVDEIKKATGAGIRAAAACPGVVKITAVNFEGKLGPYKIYLREALG